MTTTNGGVKDAPRTIRATVDELKTTFYDTPNLQATLEALHQDGFVVLKSIVDVNHADQINSYMSKEADELVKNRTKLFKQGVNSNILQAPPLLHEEYLHNDVFWSHAHTSGADRIPVTSESKLANAKLVFKKGDVMLRDLRTWHAGMPNEGEDYRIMTALGYQAQWYPNHTPVPNYLLAEEIFFMKHGRQPLETY
ncbi:hypothetical protein EYC80_006332 [Monilinia laxa]|uniref:Phytanoyl-CoA dioxygenase n=1 Tax=Monilinia laxa TaxID=61186 RepID=A0A5N6JUK1_MONLA|nr:hypothetical protein EYC80_006332 [Monilinia laxa]